ncbi:MAG: hypothetical protein JNK04_12080 [Myxococcales bacterium]|nr:hypothetical protein [Myxococcales bacterium]
MPPCSSYDDSAPGSEEARWVAAAVLESIERLSHYSSYYSGPASLPRLRKLAELGRASPEMARRLEMVEARMQR